MKMMIKITKILIILVIDTLFSNIFHYFSKNILNQHE
jgi:hypothetical protein